VSNRLTDTKPDIFVANKSYPDAKGLFYGSFSSLESVKKECAVVLDTNALLVPYGVSKNSLSEIEATYAPLAHAKRLVIPGQVAREFARNRPGKIADIFQAFSRKRNLSAPDRGRYPLLEGTEEYEKIQAIEDSIEKLLGEYRSAISQVLDHIKNWNWNDPVSKLYSKLFPDLVVDPTLNEDEVTQQLDYHHANKLPPGYKDASKDDRGIGDQLVWNCVVAIAEGRKCPVVLVSGDSKPDWFYRSEGQPLFPRYELVDEIRRVSGGKSLHIVNFSTFLELFGANPTAVGEVRNEEIKVDLSNMSRHARAAVTSHLAEIAVEGWITDHFPQTKIRRDEKYGDFIWSDAGGATVLIEVKFFERPDRNETVQRLRYSIDRIERLKIDGSFPYDSFKCFLVFESIDDCKKSIELVQSRMMRDNRDLSQFVFAVITATGALNVLDPFRALPVFE
jgi:hypothetical protein